MVKRKKHDKDKYYSLARQQGYRARSAFKLIQLNKKYDFLSSAKVCIDLCAAPGGWCQVAAKYMPVSSIILGIDLLPIRPIRNVKTFVCDITTQKCRQIIKQELQTWQADVVLCDGAPNVGAEYSKDAFVQNELALIAMKLAVEVLGRGGTFVTKVFRSQDYNALLWVFKQLFKKVSATKPLSSRNESAEIFVVCEEFLAPHSIDPKLLDPKHVFQQIDEEKKDGLTIFHPKYGQQKKHRQGYDDNLGVSLRNKVSVSEFICTSDPIRMLTDATEIEFTEDDSLFKDHKETTEEIKICLGDLKVLGKGDFKRLLKWRSKMMNYRNEILKEEKESCSDEADAKPAVEKEKVEMTQDEKDAVVREELALLRSAVNAKKRRQKKKEAEKKAKLRVRASIGMDLEGVDPGETEQVFSMSQLGLTKSKADVLENEAASTDDEIETGEHSGNDYDDYDETVDRQMDELYDSYLANAKDGSKTKKAIKRSKIAKRALAGESLVQDQALYDGDAKQYKEMLDIENSSDDSSSEEETSNKLVVDFKDEQKSSVVVSRWFSSNPLFKDVKTEFSDQSEKTTTVDDDGDIVPVMPMTEKEKRKIKRRKLIDRKDKREKRQQEMEEEEENLLSYNSQFEIAKAGDKINSQSTDDEKLEELKARDEKRKLIRDGMGKLVSEDKPSNKFEVVKNDDDLERFDDRTYDSDSEDYDDEDRARTLAIGQLMLRKSKQKEMIDSSYNRYAWNDQADLPDWFLDDEEKHYRPQVPIPKNILDQMKQKFLEMASKPVKKVAEARNRKKRQEMKKAKAAKKKANEIANLPDMSTREKLKAIEKAMGKSKIQKQEKVYVVSRRGGRSNGTKNTSEAKKKGRVKLVDSRMKSDKRGLEKKEKDKKRGRKRKR